MNHTGSIQLFLDTCHLIHAKGLVSGEATTVFTFPDSGTTEATPAPTVASRRKSGGCIWPAITPARTSRPSSMSTVAMLWPFPV